MAPGRRRDHGQRLGLVHDGGRRARRWPSSRCRSRSASCPRTARCSKMVDYADVGGRPRPAGHHHRRRRRGPPARHGRRADPAAGDRRAGAAEVPRRHGLAAVHRADAGRACRWRPCRSAAPATPACSPSASSARPTRRCAAGWPASRRAWRSWSRRRTPRCASACWGSVGP